jgi:hypothetical protein
MTMPLIALLATRTTANSPPALASDGVEVQAILDVTRSRQQPASLVVASTAGTGTLTATVKMWGYLGGAVAKWFPLGNGAATVKGTANEGASLEETVADGIRHVQPFNHWYHFDRLYAEIVAIGGTSTSVGVWISTGATP